MGRKGRTIFVRLSLFSFERSQDSYLSSLLSPFYNSAVLLAIVGFWQETLRRITLIQLCIRKRQKLVLWAVLILLNIYLLFWGEKRCREARSYIINTGPTSSVPLVWINQANFWHLNQLMNMMNEISSVICLVPHYCSIQNGTWIIAN